MVIDSLPRFRRGAKGAVKTAMVPAPGWRLHTHTAADQRQAFAQLLRPSPLFGERQGGCRRSKPTPGIRHVR